MAVGWNISMEMYKYMLPRPDKDHREMKTVDLLELLITNWFFNVWCLYDGIFILSKFEGKKENKNNTKEKASFMI